MKKGLSALLLASLLCASSGCQQNQKEVVNEYNIVPMPNQMTPQEGRFQLSNKVSIATAGCIPEVQAIADSLIARIRLTSGISLQSNPQENPKQPDIRFVTEDGMPKKDTSFLSLQMKSPFQHPIPTVSFMEYRLYTNCCRLLFMEKQ